MRSGHFAPLKTNIDTDRGGFMRVGRGRKIAMALAGLALLSACGTASQTADETVTSFVTAPQSHALSRPCHHEVSSMWAEAASRT